MDKQAVLDEVQMTTEKTLDLLEDKIDAIEEVGDVVSKNKTVSTILITAGVVLVAASSAYAGWKFAQRKLSARYEALSSLEIEEAKAYYSKLYKVDQFASPADAVAALVPDNERPTEQPTTLELLDDAVKAATDYRVEPGHVAYDKVFTDPRLKEGENLVITTKDERVVEVVANVFTDAIPGEWDFETEVEKRSPDRPYIITEEEYLQNEPSHEQVSLTYFEKDDVLIDAADKPIEKTDEYVGDDNLLRFGHGSESEHIVFVRNEEMECDFEIERSDGSFAEEVLGLSHSDDAFRGLRKFRSGDDG